MDDLDLTENWKDIPFLDTAKESEYLQNYEALNSLKDEINRLLKVYAATTGMSIAGAILPLLSTISIAALVSSGISLEYFRRIARLYDVMKMLLDNFGKDGVIITPRIKTNSSIIDLFIRMPDKRIFCLLLRSNGNCSVRWREDKQQFFIYKTGRSPRKWGAMTKTAERLKSVMDLKDSKSPLLGTSRAERTQRISKAVVLCGDTTIYPTHSPDHWVEFGRTASALKVYKDNLFYVVEQKNLVDFLLPPQKS